jgi:hypothetical protein
MDCLSPEWGRAPGPSGRGAENQIEGKIRMIRNFKVLGLALVAVFALSAVVASAASAQKGMLTSDGPVTLIGTQTGEKNANSLTAFGGVVTCANAKYTGHKVSTAAETKTKEEMKEPTHELLPSGAMSVTITPHYGVCNTNLIVNFSTTVDMNGCDYEFDLTETVTGTKTDEYKITATVECPPEKHIVVTMFTSATHPTSGEFCKITITQKTSYDGLIARDTTNGKIDITGTIEGIEAHKETTPWDESGLCSKQTTKEGILHIDATVEGLNSKGEATSIGISHT